MISGKLFRPLLVIAIAALQLATSTPAKAVESTANGCGVPLIFPCYEGFDPVEAEAVCDNHCPTWEAYVCSAGFLYCWGEPERPAAP